VLVEVPGRGNPADDTLLEDAVAKAKAAGMQVRTVLADRGFATAAADEALARQRVRDSVIPRRQRAAPIARTAGFTLRTNAHDGRDTASVVEDVLGRAVGAGVGA
jgi:hypothetical protein